MILYWLAIQLVIIVLKATSIIAWAWWVIFIPSFIFVIFQTGIFILSAIAIAFVESVKKVLEDFDEIIRKD